MQITIKGLGCELSSTVQDYATSKVGKLEKFSAGLLSASIGLAQRASKDSNKSHLAEIVVHAPGQVLRVEESGKTFQAAIDASSARLKEQLKKFKAKRADKGRGQSGLAELVGSIGPDGAAKKQSKSTRAAQLVVEKFNIKPMTVQEAMLQLKKSKRPFYLFSDDASRMLCVYKREDGATGLLVPESEIIEN